MIAAFSGVILQNNHISDEVWVFLALQPRSGHIWKKLLISPVHQQKSMALQRDTLVHSQYPQFNAFSN